MIRNIRITIEIIVCGLGEMRHICGFVCVIMKNTISCCICEVTLLLYMFYERNFLRLPPTALAFVGGVMLEKVINTVTSLKDE
jgi:hypothetical protein